MKKLKAIIAILFPKKVVEVKTDPLQEKIQEKQKELEVINEKIKANEESIRDIEADIQAIQKLEVERIDGDNAQITTEMLAILEHHEKRKERKEELRKFNGQSIEIDNEIKEADKTLEDLKNPELMYYIGIYKGLGNGKTKGKWKETDEEVKAEANSDLYKNKLKLQLIHTSSVSRASIIIEAKRHDKSIGYILDCVGV